MDLWTNGIIVLYYFIFIAGEILNAHLYQHLCGDILLICHLCSEAVYIDKGVKRYKVGVCFWVVKSVSVKTNLHNLAFQILLSPITIILYILEIKYLHTSDRYKQPGVNLLALIGLQI